MRLRARSGSGGVSTIGPSFLQFGRLHPGFRRMSREAITYWAIALLPPIGMFLFNFAMRGREILRTSGADWLLLLGAFDIACLLAVAEAAKQMHSNLFRESAPSVLLTTLIVTLVTWVWVVRYFEALSRTRTKTWRRLAGFAGSWGCAVALVGFHTFIFIFSGAT
jgi:lysylphosphatidylglycerol synthetase-like protein (DUF2156 family)